MCCADVEVTEETHQNRYKRHTEDLITYTAGTEAIKSKVRRGSNGAQVSSFLAAPSWETHIRRA